MKTNNLNKSKWNKNMLNERKPSFVKALISIMALLLTPIYAGASDTQAESLYVDFSVSNTPECNISVQPIDFGHFDKAKIDEQSVITNGWGAALAALNYNITCNHLAWVGLYVDEDSTYHPSGGYQIHILKFNFGGQFTTASLENVSPFVIDQYNGLPTYIPGIRVLDYEKMPEIIEHQIQINVVLGI